MCVNNKQKIHTPTSHNRYLSVSLVSVSLRPHSCMSDDSPPMSVTVSVCNPRTSSCFLFIIGTRSLYSLFQRMCLYTVYVSTRLPCLLRLWVQTDLRIFLKLFLFVSRTRQFSPRDQNLFSNLVRGTTSLTGVCFYEHTTERLVVGLRI